MMSRACGALGDLDFSSDDPSSLEEDEKVKRKLGDFISLCLMGKLCTPPDHALMCDGSRTTYQRQQVDGTVSFLSALWAAAFDSHNLWH
jgi:hypothetical protein